MTMSKRKLTPLARQLRRRQTDAERNLWARLRNKQVGGVKFRRQQFLGPYIVDFVSLEQKLIIEVDGGHHNERNTKNIDEQRAAWLTETGYSVLRFWDNDVLTNIDGVLEKIKQHLIGGFTLILRQAQDRL